jgi:L-rhamnose mutarotase
MIRHGEVIAVNPECVQSYIEYHRAVGPRRVAAKSPECNIRTTPFSCTTDSSLRYYE